MPQRNPRPIFEYNLSFSHNGKKIKAQQSAHNLDEAEKHILKAYPGASGIRMLKKMKYPHPIG